MGPIRRRSVLIHELSDDVVYRLLFLMPGHLFCLPRSETVSFLLLLLFVTIDVKMFDVSVCLLCTNICDVLFILFYFILFRLLSRSGRKLIHFLFRRSLGIQTKRGKSFHLKKHGSTFHIVIMP